MLLVQFLYTKDLLYEVKKEFRWYYYLSICIIAGIMAYLVKYLSFRTFFSLVISAAIFFGLYGLGLVVVKEPIIIDVFNEIKGKIKRGKV